jgi:hypothetical protein
VRGTPGYALQIVAQSDATYPRLAFVAAGDDHSSLGDLIDGATSSPVFRSAGHDTDAVALAVAKTFATDDTVLFGRVLIVQAAARSAVLQADARLSSPPAPTGVRA